MGGRGRSRPSAVGLAGLVGLGLGVGLQVESPPGRAERDRRGALPVKRISIRQEPTQEPPQLRQVKERTAGGAKVTIATSTARMATDPVSARAGLPAWLPDEGMAILGQPSDGWRAGTVARSD